LAGDNIPVQQPGQDCAWRSIKHFCGNGHFRLRKLSCSQPPPQMPDLLFGALLHGPFCCV
jgi:hypothetical protein